jgi:hypothetical protein
MRLQTAAMFNVPSSDISDIRIPLSDSGFVITDAYHPPMILDIHLSLQNFTQKSRDYLIVNLLQVTTVFCTVFVLTMTEYTCFITRHI